jgi:alpha-L-fucosidase 2
MNRRMNSTSSTRQLIVFPLALAAWLSPLLLASAADSTTRLWYEQPATAFEEALPLGNGRLGAMIFGGVDRERMVLNESSMWSGSPSDYNRPDAYLVLPEIRRLLLAGKNAEAQKLVAEKFNCLGKGTYGNLGATSPFGCYQTLGNLFLNFSDGTDAVENYRRELDLETALARVTYHRGGVNFTREHFLSAPDQVLVSRLTADQPGSLSFTVTLDRPERFTTTASGTNELLMTGHLNDGHGKNGIEYTCRVRVLVKGGEVRADGDSLVIIKADEATVLMAAATDFQGKDQQKSATPPLATSSDLNRAASRNSADLEAAHRRDYQNWFQRMSLKLDATANSALPTDARLRGFSAGQVDPALGALYLNFGRYLLISSSRPGGLPPNLQGIWAEEIQTPWNGDWHINMNLPMNYWPAEICNLSELHEPYLKFTASLVEPGRATAKKYYNARGWVVHAKTNLWGFTAPGEKPASGLFPGGAAWVCSGLWEHYAFTGDAHYLAWAYPILKEAAQFYLDILIEEPRHHWLVTAPSTSPENSYRLPGDGPTAVCLGATIDMQLLRELFRNTARAAEILNVDTDLRRELTDKRARLAPNQIGPDGCLQEWLEPYAEAEPKHRHTAHLYGLHPSSDITLAGTPSFAAACRKTLEARGDKSTGWAMGWRINLWARLGDGDRAYQLLKGLLKPVKAKGGGSYPNLFDSCPPFQIDGNFGGAAGIVEMLLQSQEPKDPSAEPYRIELLPALPKAWSNGELRGVRARGGFELDLAWKDGALTRVTIRSLKGTACQLVYRDKSVPVQLAAGESTEFMPTHFAKATQ